MSDGQERFWQSHYAGLAAAGQRWLDYSNERCQAQSFALALEAAGPVDGRDCLDVGCGHGQLALMLRGLGARDVTGVDLVASVIAANARRHPDVTWLAGSPLSAPLATFDLVFAVEVLQYLPLDAALGRLWRALRPGGRLVGIVPNRDCPFVQRAVARFEDQYAAPTPPELERALAVLPDRAGGGFRGLAFAADQQIAPYEATPWSSAPAWRSPPNRVCFVALKAAG